MWFDLKKVLNDISTNASKISDNISTKIKDFQDKIIIDSQEKLDKNLKDNKKLILIVVDLKSTLYKLYILPIVLKSWVWAYTFRVLDSKKDIIDISKYDVKEIPCLILFKEWEVEKVFEWEETVKKLVISPSLDLAISEKSDSDKSKIKDNTDEKETKWNKQEEKVKD